MLEGQVGTIGREMSERDVILDWAVIDECGKHRITLYPVGCETRYPNLSCTSESKAQKRRDPSTKTV